jgi:hypothetical protein
MDLTDTIASSGDGNAIDGAPMLPTLPAAPVLPQIIDLEVSPLPANLLPPLRPNPAANASYGAMPTRPRAGEPSPATVQAAEQRRRMKKRRRIRRIATLVIAVALAVVAGPPVARWIADGLDKAGSTKTELPPPADTAD